MGKNSCADAADSLQCLRSADINALESANVELTSGSFQGPFIFAPVVDGTFITDRPSVLLQRGKVNGVSTAYETNNFS